MFSELVAGTFYCFGTFGSWGVLHFVPFAAEDVFLAWDFVQLEIYAL
jgi:hypothetical protein